MDICNSEEKVQALHEFCNAMIDASYSPAYCPDAIRMFHEYHSIDQIRMDSIRGRIWAVLGDSGEFAGTVTVSGGELSRMFVQPALRGQGIGMDLMRKALEYVQGEGWKKLTAWSVPFSRGFYEKFGFRMLNADTYDFNYRRDVPVPYIEMALYSGAMPAITVARACVGDIDEMLAGQKLAFEEQCRIYDDWDIPPMKERRQDVEAFMASGGVVLKAEAGGRIVGAVRGKASGGVCEVGRLYVLPEYQGRGAARMLIALLEETMGDAQSFSIFTGEKSEKNIALYQRQGYELTGRRAPAKLPGSEGNYDLVWLEKPNPWPEIENAIRRSRMV